MQIKNEVKITKNIENPLRPKLTTQSIEPRGIVTELTNCKPTVSLL